MSLTDYLLKTNEDGFKKATQSPFLEAAGAGRLGKEVLSRRLSQDRLYAQGYVRFIGMMLAKMRLPTTVGRSAMPWRLTDILISSLTNVRRELGFFEDTAKNYGLDLDCPDLGENTYGPTPVTRAYLDLFINAASPGASILEGLVCLWATEKCYHTAWLYARHSMLEQTTQGNQHPGAHMDADGGALREEFIPNWTNSEFGEFVQQLEDLVNELAGFGNDWAFEEERGKCEEVWKQVLWLEERFWPVLEP